MSDEWELRDEWRRNQSPRHNSYPPPAVPIYDFSEGETCVCLKINSKWIPFITGVIDMLNDEIFWETETPEFPLTSISELLTALHGESNLMNCEPPAIQGIRFEDGVLEVFDGENWTPIEGTEAIVTGVAYGAGGIEVTQGGAPVTVPDTAECDLHCYETPSPNGEPSTDRSCAIARGLTEWWFEKLQDSLDQAEAAADTVAALDLITLLFPPLYLVTDQITDAMNEWTEAGIGIVRALDTVEAREAFEEALYCHLADNSHEFTEEIWQAFRDEYISTMPPLLVYYDWFQNAAIVDRAMRESYGDNEGCAGFGCAGCIPNGCESGGSFGGYGCNLALDPEISEPNRWSTPNTGAGNWWGATWLEPVKVLTATVTTWGGESPSNAQLEYWDEAEGEWVTVHSYAGTSYPFTFENSSFDVAAKRWRILITSTGWVSFAYVNFTCEGG